MTRGLGISDSRTSDNLTPQETPKQDSPDMGFDGARLSCPGSSVGADSESMAARFENTTAPETIGAELVSSFSSQSLAEESEAGEKPIKPDWK
jgi:hypothetical protein